MAAAVLPVPDDKEALRALLAAALARADEAKDRAGKAEARAVNAEAREPELIESPLSRPMQWDGVRLDIQIYRIATERGWTLEVDNERGTSIVWDNPFASDRDADAAFRDTLAREGVLTFLDND